jgi:hypothetical protein
VRAGLRTLLFPLLLAGGTPAFAQTPTVPAPAKAVPAPMAWEERRAEYFRLLQSLQARDPNAVKIFDAIIADFGQHPLHRTPMENMDILGTYFAAKDPPAKLVPVVVMNATLGWYDALRYGSPSGREEIVSQERFFVRAFTMAGPDVQKGVIAFLKGPPGQVAMAVQHGLELAARMKDTDQYDRTWPAAYGKERLAGTPVPVLPARLWPAAWQAANAKVEAFYQIKPAPERLQYSPEVRRQSATGDQLFHDLVSAPGGVAMMDEVTFPQAAQRRIAKIEVLTPFPGSPTWTEHWTIDHGGGPAGAYTVTLAPDGQGGTNFQVKAQPGK